MSRRGWLLFVAMGVIWGLPYLLIKISVREVSAPMLVEMRTGGAALLPFARREIGLALVPGTVFAEGIGCAVLLGLVSAAAPARRGARLSVAAALSGR